MFKSVTNIYLKNSTESRLRPNMHIRNNIAPRWRLSMRANQNLSWLRLCMHNRDFSETVHSRDYYTPKMDILHTQHTGMFPSSEHAESGFRLRFEQWIFFLQESSIDLVPSVKNSNTPALHDCMPLGLWSSSKHPPGLLKVEHDLLFKLNVTQHCTRVPVTNFTVSVKSMGIQND